jgi:hypothetical protein
MWFFKKYYCCCIGRIACSSDASTSIVYWRSGWHTTSISFTNARSQYVSVVGCWCSCAQNIKQISTKTIFLIDSAGITCTSSSTCTFELVWWRNVVIERHHASRINRCLSLALSHTHTRKSIETYHILFRKLQVNPIQHHNYYQHLQMNQKVLNYLCV